MVRTPKKKTIPIFLCLFEFVCLSSLFTQFCYGQESPNSSRFQRVAGGTPAPKGRFPYMCSIRQRGSRDHACGGMLVASKWILTAAHCLDPANVRSTGRSPLIYCGIHRRQEREDTKTFGTSRCYLHHLWTGSVLEGNDIALCELDRASSSPIPDLVTAGDAFGRFDRFTVLGWGVSADSSQYAEQLQMGSDLRFVPEATCDDIEGWRGRITKSMICAGFNDPNTCSGDSGGPLLVPDEDEGSVELGDSSRDLIVGVTSFGDPSCDELIPGVYTRISCYRSWINCIIAGTGKDCSVHVPCEEPPFGCSGAARSARFNRTAAIQTIRTAIENDDAATVEMIICEGLNPNTTSGFLSETLLELAARNDAVESAKVLLRHGAAIENYDSDALTSPRRFFLDTSLHTAAAYGSVGVAEVLIKNGANINAMEIIGGYTPLMRAVFAKKLNTLQFLLRKGADIQIRASDGYTALHYAARNNFPDISKALIDNGADIESVIHSESTGRSHLRILDSVSKADEDDDGGWTSLHLTARYNSSDVTKVLLDAGAYVESETFRGSSPLHIAAMSSIYDVAKILIDRGADLNSEDRTEWTPLHFAAQNNSLAIAKTLTEAGAEKEAKTTSGYDPLMIASFHGSLSVVEFLIDESVSSGSANGDGDTPLHLAASRGQVSVVQALLQNRASKVRTDNKGQTPFDVICSRLSEGECSNQTSRTLRRLLRIE